MHYFTLKPLFYTFLSSFILLSGCTNLSTQTSTNEDTPIESINEGQPLVSDYWSVSSKIGFKTSEESGSAGLTWLQDGEAYDIKLLDPLGRSLGQVISDGKTVEFKSKDRYVSAESVDDVVFRLLGRPFPVKELKYWIKGLKAPLIAVEPISASGTHLEFNQADWHVHMSKFIIEDGYRLPKKLKLSYPANTVEPVFELKIAIKSWSILDAGEKLTIEPSDTVITPSQ